MATAPVKVLLVDDSLVVRQRLSATLAEHQEFDIVGEASNAVEALEMMRSFEPDVVIMDIRLPGRSGIGLLEDIKGIQQKPKIVMLTNYPYLAYRRRCMELGADYFFDKSSEFERVVEVLRGMAPTGR